MTTQSIIHNFNVYEEDFHNHQYNINIKGVGWNGREIDIIPLYNLMKFIPNDNLMNLKPFDIIHFDDNRAYDSYLIVPLRVKNIFNIELTNIEPNLKNLVLSYGIIEFIFDCAGENACIPPEGIEAIEKYDIHFFDCVKEMEDVEGIIIDHMYIKNNFNKVFSNQVEMIGEPFEYDQIGFIWIVNEYKLTLNDARNDDINSMKNCSIIIPMMKTIEQMNCVQLIYSVIKNLPEHREEPYKNSIKLLNEENNENIFFNKNDINRHISTSTSKLISKKKDKLIEMIINYENKIHNLEIELSYLKTDNELNITNYKKLKEINIEHKSDSNFLKNTVSIGMDNIKQYLSKIENEINKIKPDYC